MDRSEIHGIHGDLLVVKERKILRHQLDSVGTWAEDGVGYVEVYGRYGWLRGKVEVLECQVGERSEVNRLAEWNVEVEGVTRREVGVDSHPDVVLLGC